MTIELQTAMQVKLWKPEGQVSQNDVIIMATDGMWDVVSNQVKEAAKKVFFFSGTKALSPTPSSLMATFFGGIF